MKYYLFHGRFVAPIIARTKTQTLRGHSRRTTPKPGERFALRAWFGEPYRSSQYDVVPPVTCLGVVPVRLVVAVPEIARVWWNGVEMPAEDVPAFCVQDGFESVRDFAAYQIAHERGAFDGVAILWD